ncbi:MAG: hypothetical protein IJD59_02000 [Clostridia bacterium]|nr:hypothetical protein [Clostridia bacterium]
MKKTVSNKSEKMVGIDALLLEKRGLFSAWKMNRNIFCQNDHKVKKLFFGL